MQEIKEAHRELAERVIKALIEHGLSEDRATEVFIKYMGHQERKVQDLKLPGISEDVSIEVIRSRIGDFFEDPYFMELVRGDK